MLRVFTLCLNCFEHVALFVCSEWLVTLVYACGVGVELSSVFLFLLRFGIMQCCDLAGARMLGILSLPGWGCGLGVGMGIVIL